MVEYSCGEYTCDKCGQTKRLFTVTLKDEEQPKLNICKECVDEHIRELKIAIADADCAELLSVMNRLYEP